MVAMNPPAPPAAAKVGQLIDVHTLPAEKAVDTLVEQAVALRSSDLFFTTNEQHVAVMVRHLGVVRLLSILPSELGKKCLAHIKAAARIDTTATRKPMDGRWIFEPRDGDSVDIRINVIPTVYGEDFALRLLIRGGGMFKLEDVGMTGQQYDQYSQMLASPSGLILVCGPTGSGKSATMYASLVRLNDGRKKINTIEDPVEYLVDGIRQSQVNSAVDLGFGELLRAVLLQSPDVIMVGEIRDAETAQIAAHAANSGTLVFATIHAPSAPGAIQSMRSLGVHSHFLANGLRGVVSQRLVRTLCEKCRVSFDLTDAPDTFEEVKPMLSDGEGKKLWAPRGCEACNKEGYGGRTGVFEVMQVTRKLRDVVSDGAATSIVREAAIAEGMLEFRQAALLKVAKGLTSTEEVFRVIPPEHLMLDA
jgi:type II secretory ATPase GspE/PulE/Tfp pilus assembly ATPase PilB-like protein